MRAQTHVLDFHDFAGLLVPEAFAGSALAADVTLYGVVDLGLQYTHSDPDTAAGATDKLQMASGSEAGPRFGLKGVEQLGNGVEVGFVLENGFSADTGALGNNNRLFGRQSTLFVRGSFGEIAFGRMGQLTSGNGSYGLTGNLSPFGPAGVVLLKAPPTWSATTAWTTPLSIRPRLSAASPFMLSTPLT